VPAIQRKNQAKIVAKAKVAGSKNSKSTDVSTAKSLHRADAVQFTQQ
jgi:hypothetical protein